MKKIFTNYDLKLIATFTMILDHLAIIFLPSNSIIYMILRFIGRISFPIYAFLIVEGFFHTKSLTKYLSRLIFLAFISEPIYDYALYNSYFDLTHQNIFFTLTLGLLTIILIDKGKNLLSKKITTKTDNFIISSFLTILTLIILGLANELLGNSYGFRGIFLISSFYLFRHNLYLITIILITSIILTSSPLEIASVFSIIFIILYNGNLGKSKKSFFYSIYPIHLIVLKLLSFLC